MSDYANPEALVSAEWAQGHFDDPGVRFVEVDFDTESYGRGHLPGAVGWNWETQLSDGIRRDIVSRGQLSELLSSSGIGADTHVVLYGDDYNWYAAWAYWQLKLHSVGRVSLLNGGRQYWLAHDLRLDRAVPSYAPTGIDVPEPDFATRAFLRDIIDELGEPDLALVDVRSPAEYGGEVTSPRGYPAIAQRAGHISGAVSAPWEAAANEDGTFKSTDQLRMHYAAKGVTAGAEIVTYCGVGVRSSHTWFVLHELLGFENVRNYDGSWAEWGSVIGLPIENPAAGHVAAAPTVEV